MRAKSIPVPSSVKTFWSRITVTRLTTCFFVLALLHCIVQVVFQVMAFKTNEYAGKFLGNIIEESGITNEWAVLVQGGELRLCNASDTSTNIMECPVVWSGQLAEQLNQGSSAPSSSSVAPSPEATQPGDSDDDDDDDDERNIQDLLEEAEEAEDDLEAVTTTVFVLPTQGTARGAVLPQRIRRNFEVTAVKAPNGTVTSVEIPTIVNSVGQEAKIDLNCVQMLIWPNQIIRNTKRQDVTFIAFQVWVFGMSLVAVLNESIPHILAALSTHLLATVWSGYQIWNTSVFRDEFVRTTIDSEVCQGINLLPDYWARRNAAELGVVVVNAISLLAYIFFTYKLVKSFGWQTFKRIGASLEINYIYKLVLTFSIGLQLALFFIVASMGLWFDYLINTVLGQRALNGTMYKVIALVVIVLMVPWCLLGWYAVRKEHKVLMSTFLGCCVVLLAGWGGMFASNTFRWTFTEWPFFAAMSAASSAILFITTILGVVCFMKFNKGLKRFLEAQEPLPGDDFARVNNADLEKSGVRVDFPSAPIPSYEVAFGGKEKMVFPVQINPFADVPEYTQTTVGSVSGVRPPQQATILDRAPSNASSRSYASTSTNRDPFSLEHQRSLRRLSSGSEQSGSTSTQVAKTYVSAGSHHVPTTTTKHVKDASDVSGAAKRGWVIE